jgi:pimeloyl-ACP methyl ester carboxylesterase
VAAARGDPATLPILFFLTGLDGAGLAAWRAFDSLAARFDVRVLTVPAADRTPFGGLVELVVDAVVAEVVVGAGGGGVGGAHAPRPATRPVYLAGESFGCLLALAAAAAAPGAVDRLVLVNPATCFSKSPWAALGPAAAAAPPQVYAALPWLLAPALGNPLNIIAGRVTPGASPRDALAQLAGGVAGLLPQLDALGDALPAATLSHRLELLKTGEAAVNPLLPSIRARTLVVAGARDSLLPSAREAERLVKTMPRCRSFVLPNATHAMLQEAGVDLGVIIEQKGFYEAVKRTSTPALARAAAGGGPAAPVHLPTPGELDDWTERATRTMRRLTSPVFLSTLGGGEGANSDTPARVVRGLAGLPRDGPTLFVGNHQLMALDMGMMVEEVKKGEGFGGEDEERETRMACTLPPASQQCCRGPRRRRPPGPAPRDAQAVACRCV